MSRTTAISGWIGTVLLVGAAPLFADEWDSSVSWDISGQTVFSTSKHFDIRKTPTHEDGSANNPAPTTSAMNTAFGYLENAWTVYHEQMKFIVPDAASAIKHKVRVYLYEKIDALYGGADQYGPGLWLGIGALLDNWGLAHEYSHGLQSISGGMQRSDYASWFYESHANWMAHQVIPSNAHCSEMLVNYPYLYLGSTRDRYCNWQFFEYLKDRHGGTDAVNDIWRNSLRSTAAGVTQETPFTALMRNKNWSVATFNDTIGDWAMHNVTWDYSNGAVYRSNYGSYDDRSRQKRNRVTMLERTDSVNNRYLSPSYWAPQALGYNLVRIYPDQSASNSTITVKFRGITQATPNSTSWGSYEKQPASVANPNSDWRWGVVAIDAGNNPRYSALQKGAAGDMNFQVLSSDKAVYMVVVATPSVYTRIFWDQMYYTLYRYPYMVEFAGAKAEGYQANAWAAPAGTTCRARTANWQGCVASTATVDASVYVAPNARILGSARVTGNVRLEGMATVQNATVSGYAVIRDQARVLGGTVAENALVEDHASVYAGTVNGSAQVGALSLVDGGTVSGSGKFYGVMNQLGSGVTIGGTAQMLGDNEIYSTISTGVFYGMVDDGIKNNSAWGAARTAPVVEVTAPGPYTWPNVSASSSSSAPVSSSSATVSSSSAAVSSSSVKVSSSSATASSSSTTASSSSAASSCIAFVNGVGGYLTHCYNTGLAGMAANTCYTQNPATSAVSWINANANETYWWSVTPCTGTASSSSVAASSSSVKVSSSSVAVSSSSVQASSSSVTASSSSAKASSSSAASSCIAFVNGVGNYASNCYSSGLTYMASGVCYTLNPERGVSPTWINANANDSWWWSPVSCTGIQVKLAPSLASTISSYRVYGLDGRPLLRSRSYPQQLPAGRWIVIAQDRSGNIVQRWVESRNY